MIRLYPVLLILVALALVGYTVKTFAWEHTVIMFPPAGSSFTVPLVPDARNCVYVTDCSEQIGTQPTPTQPDPVVISDIPNIRGIDGWSFGVPIDRTGWTVEADNEHEAAERAIDVSVTTIWRTGSAGAADQSHPHQIIIDLQTDHWVDGLVYTPRPYDPAISYAENGNITDYEVWVSKDKNVWGRVANGTMVYDAPGQSHSIELLIPNQARYIKLIALADLKNTGITVAGDIQITESLPDQEVTGGGIN
jgi:hypothetical protein